MPPLTKHPKMILEAIEAQSFVPRYSTKLTVQPRQSVAEHIGRGSLLMIVVMRELSLSPAFNEAFAYRTLAEFVSHDLGESMTGDVISSTKEEVPEVEVFEDAMRNSLSSISLFLGGGVGPREVWDIIPVIVSMVDYAEGTMYSTKEVRLGNTDLEVPLKNYTRGLEVKTRKVEEFFSTSLPSMRMLLRCGEQTLARQESDRWHR